DVGRLPHSSSRRDGTSPDTATLIELWDRQGKLAMEFPYRFRSGPSQPVDYSSVRLPCGWRGPYLTLGVGQESIVDPWGRPFDCWEDTSGAVTEVRTRPLPGSVDIQTLEVDLTVGLVTVSGVLSWREQAPPTEMKVVLLTPDPQQSLEVLAVRADEDPEASSFLFSDVPVGLRAICIQANDRLIVRYVTVPPGGVALNLSIGGTEP
ncbi:MAG TPA: hypothetical protein PKD54_02670, partial [Pirellulaceae bacterium]|nr:hypothetical protein [Pirellulaceae bacterium]